MRIYSFEYDSLDRLIRSWETDGSGILIQRTEHIYDSAGRLISQNWQFADGTELAESYTCDASDGKLATMPKTAMRRSLLHRTKYENGKEAAG